MPDRKIVVKGLDCCTFILGKRKCNDCPYKEIGCYQLQDDFHTLLKEPELIKNDSAHLQLDIDVPEDCARCVFGEEGGYCCALTGGEVCTRENGRQVWCPFDNDGSTITVPGVKIVKDICL